ncbi:8605_t:CDS:2 [Gigaspora margarita]|uniref:8605_t:CDS:1 n=1 Tax=Gigaspora margarita TaxID=4874 RepID=A0ABN7UBT2_GIGMA|nr:8605_t:CDS:2 [Gigaspora margarita]
MYWLNGERDDIRDITYYSEDYFSGHEDYKGYEYWYDDERRKLNLLYLTGSLPTSIETVTPKCKKIEITCESHDQGWSDYPESHGTYDSHTWGEVSIITTTHNYDDKFIVYNAVEKEPKIRYKVYTNKHADYSWQVHNYVFLSDHPLVQSLQPGDFVGLWIRSRYPGWCNYIK